MKVALPYLIGEWLYFTQIANLFRTVFRSQPNPLAEPRIQRPTLFVLRSRLKR